MRKIYLAIFSAAIIPALLPILSGAQTSEEGNTKTSPSKTHKYFSFPERIVKGDYQDKTVVLKVKPNYSSVCSLTHLNNYLLEIGGANMKRKFPHAQKPEREFNPQGLKYADITRIYQFTYTAEIPLETVINTIYAMNIVEYAEPNYIMKPFYNPNDPNLGTQWHITKIKCPQAWDVNKGDTNIVVGIVDSEIQYDHPDLSPNIKYNYSDPVDGQDNDGDGYVDNYRGYDLGEGDNDTKSSSNLHGSHVSGCSSAATDNGIGVAGSGFKCKFLPVKIANSSGSLIAGYEGIEYAANHGAKIINCSWGSAGGGQAGQDVIDYVTINKDALVVAAAGNDANEIELFPAAYNYALSVAASTSADKKASFSSYGTWVDITSPGENIYATYPTNSYSYLSGTSMASPVAAGAAAIVKSNYPFLNALQVGEQLRMTCDPMPTESAYTAGKMGKGRINLFTAVSGITSPSIVMTQKNITDKADEAFVSGDTLDISGTFVNYLLASGNVTATLTTTTSTYITIVDGSSSLGSIPMMGSADNNSDPFRIVIKPSTPINAKANFIVTLSDGSYTTKAYLSFTVNVDYINVAINEVATSITSKSLIGFNDFSTQLEGLGFRYIPGDGQNLLFDGGLMVGITGKVSDHVRDPADAATVDQDFASVVRVTRTVPSVVSEFDVKGVFNDNPAGTSAKLPVEVAHKAYAWNTAGHRRYVMVEYSIKNTGTTPLNSMYAGIFTDWDINMGSSSGYDNNKSNTDTTRKIGYTYNLQTGGFYAGVQLLTTSNANFNHYAIDNDGSNSSVNIYSSYTTAEKYTTLSTMRLKGGDPTTTDPQGARDQSNVVSGGPFNLAAGDSVTIAFALLAGDDLTDFQRTADSACAMYPFKLLSGTNSPTCGSNNGTATVSVVGCGNTYSYLWSNGQTSATATGLGAGNFSVTVTNPYGRTNSMIVSLSNAGAPTTGISSTDATCGLSDGTVNVTVAGGTTPYSFSWSNGATTSSLSNLDPGNYLVTVTDANNCIATGSATVNSSSNMVISITSSNTVCGSTNGSATVAVSGGTTPYTYSWSNGATSAALSGLSAGTYTVTVTDATNCSVPVSITIYSLSSITAPVSVTDASAYGVCDGSAGVTASGGTTPYTYLWSNSQTTATATGLCAGNYSVTITDAASCTYVTSSVVSQPTSIKDTEINSSSFRVYPNPASGSAMVQFVIPASEKNAEFSIYNMIGEAVYTAKIASKGQITVDLTFFESGVYFCNLKTTEGVVTRKMTVVE